MRVEGIRKEREREKLMIEYFAVTVSFRSFCHCFHNVHA
jgi:hypothetical protein